MKNFIAATSVALALAVSAPEVLADAKPLVVSAAKRHGVPVHFALRVAKVESGVKCGRTGAAGEKGPLQILPSTARGLGYKNIRAASCATQTDAGMKHLAICYKKTRNLWRAAACHNQGISVAYGRKVNKQAARYANKVAR
jgi:soluble lytic murein transglycosylase-like protein